MKIEFSKYHGTGNDFIIIDNRSGALEPNPKLISLFCDRRTGIGADGLMTLINSNDHDFRMKYYNSDGFEGTMCGNGGRCIVAFASKLGLIELRTAFITSDGIHRGEIISEDHNTCLVRISMNDITMWQKSIDHYFVDSGSPHYINFVGDAASINVMEEGKKIRYGEKWRKDGVNVDFVEIKNYKLFVRTYERGVEDETLSCGTGATASAVAASLKYPEIKSPVEIATRGGKLKVSFNKKGEIFKDVFLEGAAAFVYKGVIDI